MKIADELGNKYGKLTVVERKGSRYGKASWLCKCRCGNTTIVIGDHLRRGETRSCGCLPTGRAVYPKKTKKYLLSVKTKCHRMYSLRKLGWTVELFEQCKKKQKGKCFICKARMFPPHADHKHGYPPTPRKLLCFRCNAGLGLFKENPHLLNKAIKYLDSYK